MQPTRRQALRTMAAGTAAAATALAARPAAAWASSPDVGRIIERDVVVVGGGSSGTYTAVRLRDLGKSVAVVESKDHLGGHVNTYRDPATGLTTDFGVMEFHDLPLVRDYFGRFGVPLVHASQQSTGTTAFADFRTGQAIAGYTPPIPTALGTYFEILQKYPYIATGWDLPDPVPAELLQPFGDFVAANNLGSIVQLVFEYGQGFFNGLLGLPTVYILKYFGLGVVGSILSDSFLTTPDHDNIRLYQQATAFLGDDVLLSSTVVAAGRGAEGVALLTDTPQGLAVIKARKLVITIPPLPGALAPFGLDGTEFPLFSRFQHANYYAALLSLPGVSDSLTVQNIGADTPYNLPPLPAIYAIMPSGIPSLFGAWLGTPQPFSDAAARTNIVAAIGRLQAAGTLPATQPRFVDYASHTPCELTVSASDIAGGFYRSLFSLQGHRSTFWNGAAFHIHDSSLLWQFTESLLPQIAA
jgi:Flavin containing amine oxidoreductase